MGGREEFPRGVPHVYPVVEKFHIFWDFFFFLTMDGNHVYHSVFISEGRKSRGTMYPVTIHKNHASVIYDYVFIY